MAHLRIRAQRGPARDHRCQYCGVPAQQWAYDYCDRAERRGKPKWRTVFSRGSLYSQDPSHYLPLCVGCHIRLDRSAPIMRVIEVAR